TAHELAVLDNAEAMDVLVTVGLLSDNYELEKYIGGRLKKIRSPDSVERLCYHANQHKDHRVRLVLSMVLAGRSERNALKAALTNLYDNNQAVVFATLEGLRERKSLSVVDHLIRALQHQEDLGRGGDLICYEFRQALLELTGEDFELAADWQNFWGAHKNGFERKVGEGKKKLTFVNREPPLFFGTEVLTKRVVFVLDISGSMSKKDPLPEEEGDARNKRNKPANIPDSRQRLRRVQKELINVITKLPQDTQFNIITFNHEIGFFRESLVPASSTNKSRAIAFVRAFQAEGETHTDAALRAVFDLPGIDAIFLLSDGAPRRNDRLLDIDPIIRWVRQENRFRRVRLNTVAFQQGGKTMRRFMRQLAQYNNGQYKELR
ncbi:MAG: VWA domain-containing protein, partial [Planctomycetota bacterium]